MKKVKQIEEVRKTRKLCPTSRRMKTKTHSASRVKSETYFSLKNTFLSQPLPGVSVCASLSRSCSLSVVSFSPTLFLLQSHFLSPLSLSLQSHLISLCEKAGCCQVLFQPVLHDWCNKGFGMCYPVCGMVHIIGKSSPCGGSGFPLALSVWSFTMSDAATVTKCVECVVK